MKRTWILGCILFILLTVVWACGSPVDEKQPEYRTISMKEAQEIFSKDGSYVIVDVRREDEYASGHIPGAIHIANEEINDEKLAELPALDQDIYVYCRSGRRSKEAAAKLVAIGYTNIIECGGIMDWTGEIYAEGIE